MGGRTLRCFGYSTGSSVFLPKINITFQCKHLETFPGGKNVGIVDKLMIEMKNKPIKRNGLTPVSIFWF